MARVAVSSSSPAYTPRRKVYQTIGFEVGVDGVSIWYAESGYQYGINSLADGHVYVNTPNLEFKAV